MRAFTVAEIATGTEAERQTDSDILNHKAATSCNTPSRENGCLVPNYHLQNLAIKLRVWSWKLRFPITSE